MTTDIRRYSFLILFCLSFSLFGEDRLPFIRHTPANTFILGRDVQILAEMSQAPNWCKINFRSSGSDQFEVGNLMQKADHSFIYVLKSDVRSTLPVEYYLVACSDNRNYFFPENAPAAVVTMTSHDDIAPIPIVATTPAQRAASPLHTQASFQAALLKKDSSTFYAGNPINGVARTSYQIIRQHSWSLNLQPVFPYARTTASTVAQKKSCIIASLNCDIGIIARNLYLTYSGGYNLTSGDPTQEKTLLNLGSGLRFCPPLLSANGNEHRTQG